MCVDCVLASPRMLKLILDDEPLPEVVLSQKGVRFNAQRKSPHKMGAIIKNNQIIFITRDGNNWRGPHIIMY
jgi:hypothetical protein